MMTANFDMLVANGTLVTAEHGEFKADIAIRDGKVVALLKPGMATAKRLLDAAGKFVLPGCIEPHIHIGHGAPHAEEFDTETAGASVGGITTILTYFRKNPYNYHELLPDLIEQGERNARIDFGVHLVISIEDNLKRLPDYVDKFGITSFKFFLGHDDPSLLKITDLPHTGAHVPIDDAFILKGFRLIGEIPGALAVAHCENSQINKAVTAEAKALGLTGLDAWEHSRPDISEAEGVRRACYWAEIAQTPLYAVHLSSSKALTEIQFQRQRTNLPVYAETMVQYLTLSKSLGIGALAKMNPPLRSSEQNDRLWLMLHSGVIDTVGSDHGAFMRADKTEIWSSRTGTPSAPTVLPALLSEG